MDRQKSKSDREIIREEKRNKANHLQNMKYAIATIAILIVILYLLAAFVLFKIEVFDISGLDTDGNVTAGSTYYTDDDIVAASGLKTGDSLIQLSEKKIINNIKAYLPYLGEITIKRSFPSTLKITVIDYPAKYAVKSTDGYTLLNSEFKVIETASEIPDGCADLKGTEIKFASNGNDVIFTDDASEDRIKGIVDACKEFDISDFTLFDFTNLADIVFEIDGKTIVHLGRNTEIYKKISLMKKSIEDEMKNNSDLSIIINVANIDHAYVRSNSAAVKEDTSISENITDGNYTH